MHKHMRVSETFRRELLQNEIDACVNMIQHLDACKDCNDDNFCAAGDVTYLIFLISKAKAKHLVLDNDGKDQS